jgi:hypothetical protein
MGTEETKKETRKQETRNKGMSRAKIKNNRVIRRKKRRSRRLEKE